MVGGLLRDFLLKREKEVIDCDLAVEGPVLDISQAFSREINGSWFILDEENYVYRVVKQDIKKWQFDFSLLRGSGIISDLESRDYSVNAMAVELEQVLKSDFENLIDPCNGKEDLKKGVVRAIREENLISDPLRILRGVSLASELGFKIEKETLEWLKKYAHLLKSEAGERISEELFKILRDKFSHSFFMLMQEVGILEHIFPGWGELKRPYPGPYHHLSIDLHSIESLHQLEILLEELKGWNEIEHYLNEEVREGRRRSEILKLASLLHDIGKAPAYLLDEEGKVKFTGHEKIGSALVKEISLRLKLSRKEKQMLSDMIYYHLRPGFLVGCINESKRAVYRYFRDAGEEAISIILLSIADKEATRGELVTEEEIKNHKEVLLQLLRNYFQEREKVKPPKLITGFDVMEILGITPSPQVGKILKEVEEKQAVGEIKTREEAIQYLNMLKSFSERKDTP